jgi:hypothetical protein
VGTHFDSLFHQFRRVLNLPAHNTQLVEMAAVDFVLKEHFLLSQALPSAISIAPRGKQPLLQEHPSVRTVQLVHILQTLQTGLVIRAQWDSSKTHLAKAHACHAHLGKPPTRLLRQTTLIAKVVLLDDCNSIPHVFLA